MKRKHNKGLTGEQVIASRQRYGDNVLTPPAPVPLWKQFLKKFDDPLIKILLVALGLSIGMSIYEYFRLHMGMSIFFEPLGILIAVVFWSVAVVIFVGQIVLVQFFSPLFNCAPLDFNTWLWIILGTFPVFLIGHIVNRVKNI